MLTEYDGLIGSLSIRFSTIRLSYCQETTPSIRVSRVCSEAIKKTHARQFRVDLRCIGDNWNARLRRIINDDAYLDEYFRPAGMERIQETYFLQTKR